MTQNFEDEIDQSFNPGTASEDDFQDFFSGFGASEKFYLPDGKQYIEFDVMNEGQRSRYQRDTRAPIEIDRRSDKASMIPDQARDRHSLIKYSVTNWYMLTRDQKTRQIVPVPFSSANLKNWLEVANPKIIEDLGAAIRKANTWMLEDLSIEDIDKQIEELEEMKRDKERLELEKKN